MVHWLVEYSALVDPWLPDRVGSLRVFLVVLALPCCTETERDSFLFLALVSSKGLGCGYFGLIVSSWLTLSKSAQPPRRRPARPLAAREGGWEAL